MGGVEAHDKNCAAPSGSAAWHKLTHAPMKIARKKPRRHDGYEHLCLSSGISDSLFVSS
jgi:hypothetical protein